MIRIRLLLLSVFLTGSFAQAQVRNITGTVRDAATNTPLPGVTVMVKGTTMKAQSNAIGNFVLDLGMEKSPVLIFRYVSYTPLEVPVGNKTHLDVQLTDCLLYTSDAADER
nr:carboxypeptidase-like regulatory domain-containing protein [Pedobacter sp. ASV19]